MIKKTYEEFCTYVEEHILNRISMDGNAVVTVKTVYKTNDIIQKGLTIVGEGQNIVPTIYLEPYYEKYVQGHTTLSDTLTHIAEVYTEHMRDCPESFDIQMLKEESVIGSLINIHYNKDYLKGIPYIPVGEDFAIIFKFYLGSENEITATVTITDKLAELMELNKMKLLSLALNNTPRIYPMKCIAITEMIRTFIQEDNIPLEDVTDTDSPFYVLTNNRNENGAFVLFYPETVKNLFDTFRDDLVLIPSSTSEWLIIPAKQAVSIPNISDIIQAVNQECVDPNQLLGERAYLLRKDSTDILTQLIPLSEALLQA